MMQRTEVRSRRSEAKDQKSVGIVVACMMVSFLLVSCGKQSEVTHYREDKSPAAKEAVVQSSAPDSGHHGNAPYHWAEPKGWKSVPASGMFAL